MRKDYIPVDEPAESAGESAFVEQYWTANWKDHTQPPDTSALSRREEFRLMRPFLDRLPRGSRVLDGGCGLGEWTVFLGQQGFDVVGLDLSAEVVVRLEAWFPSHLFARGDIRDTGFETGSFDAYFSWGAFEHFESGMGDCLAEAHRILKPGGWLFISVPFQNGRHIRRDAHPLERWDPGFSPDAGYQQTHRFYQWRFTMQELRRELELRGFRTHKVTPISKLAGVGRWMQWDIGLFRPGSRIYFAARRACAAVMPASYISHMLLAVGERR